MKRLTFLEEDLKVIFEGHLRSAGFVHDDQEIVGFEYRTRTIKKDGDYYKDQVPDDVKDVFGESDLEEIRKIIVLVK